MATDYTITGDTWWTTGTSAGAGDGSSFANRMPIPTDIQNLVVNSDANLTVVIETQDGAITLGANAVASCDFMVYGGFFTVNSSGEFDRDCPYNLYIGGTASYGERLKKANMGAKIRIFNVHFGQDINGAATTSYVGYTNQMLASDAYYYNCTFKEKTAYRGVKLLGGYYDNCTFYGSNNGSGYCVSGYDGIYDVTLEDCELNTSGSYTMRYPSGVINIVGGLTLSTTGYYHYSQWRMELRYFKRAYLNMDDGTNPLSGVYAAQHLTTSDDLPPGTLKAPPGYSDGNGDMTTGYPVNCINTPLFCLDKIEVYDFLTSSARNIGTPASTTTYGDYSFVFAKSGYDLYTTTHTMTSDWGTEASPTSISLTARKDNFRFDGGTW